MKRIVVVWNPRSSQAGRVKEEVLGELPEAEKHEILDTDVDDNARKLAKILHDGDLVISAGGDATAVIGLNAVVLSGVDACFAALPYGNFNDTARSLGTKSMKDVLVGKEEEAWPLEMLLDGEHFRYDLCYFTVGMFAEATKIFDEPEKRKILQKRGKSSLVFSVLMLKKWWQKNRKKEFLEHGMTDFVAVNGKSMARVMRGKKYFLGKKFVVETGNLSGIWGLAKVMVPSMLWRVPGKIVEKAELKFDGEKEVMVQGGGEYKEVRVREIIVRKNQCVKVIMKK